MDNFIFIIPFNLPPSPESSRKRDEIYKGNPCWMESRLDLFTTYTLPSLNNQIDKEFYAILLCDPKTPPKYKKIFKQFSIDYPFIKILWNESIQWGENNDWNDTSKIIDYYKSFRQNNSNEIFAGRLDNDDAIFPGYVHNVKSIKQDCELISFSEGIFWDIKLNKFLLSHFPTGPFLSTKSTLENYIDPFSKNHVELTQTLPTINIKTEYPAWVQICHGENLWNDLSRMPGKIVDVNVEELKNYFNII